MWGGGGGRTACGQCSRCTSSMIHWTADYRQFWVYFMFQSPPMTISSLSMITTSFIILSKKGDWSPLLGDIYILQVSNAYSTFQYQSECNTHHHPLEYYVFYFTCTLSKSHILCLCLPVFFCSKKLFAFKRKLKNISSF